MSSNASTWSEPEQFDLYIKKFRSLFAMHYVGFGSPEDFPHFMVKLAQDRHFAMDFWALTGTLSKREGGELSVEQMLAVIVDAVIGGDVPAGDDGVKTLVGELAALLAGVDLYSPSRLSDEEDVETVLPPVSSSPHHTLHTKFTEMPERAADEGRAASEVPAPAVVPGPVAGEQSQSSSVPIPTAASTAATPHQFDEALMRLELKSIQLKEHLEDLDKKMSRIVPHLEVLTSKISSAEHHSSKFEETLANEVEIPVRKPAENPRLVLEPTEEPIPNKRPVSVPLAGYVQSKNRRGNGAVVAIVILFALIGSGLIVQQTHGSSIWMRGGVAVWEKYDALLEKVHSTNTGQAASNPTEPSPAATTTSDGGNSANTPQPSSALTPPPSPTTGNALEQPIAERAETSTDASQVPVSKYHSRSSRGTARPASAEVIEKAPVERASSGGGEEANAINVAPSVMEAHLVESRVPAYPEKAKENRIEGPVVVEAIISKDGFVDRVHVLEGNPHLRSAAAEAVQKWRFKPYLLNGQPVEVATTITVDFELDDW